MAFGQSYRAEVQKRGISVGRFLSVSTAEWFQGQSANPCEKGGKNQRAILNFLGHVRTAGLPHGWTNGAAGSVCQGAVAKMFGNVGLPDWAFPVEIDLDIIGITNQTARPLELPGQQEDSLHFPLQWSRWLRSRFESVRT